MEKYEDLIDVVSTIVRDYGGEILDGPKFWNVLSDSYRFSSDYSLRNAYKACMGEGHVAKIASLKGNKKDTVREIRDIIGELKKQSYKEGEVAAVLFSIAIAVGTCSKKDYEEFLRPQPQNGPSTQTPPPSLKYVRSKYAGLLVGGVISVGLGTLSYGLYLFNGWWMCFVLLLIGFIQLLGGVGFLHYMDICKKNETIRSEIASMGLPIYLAFIINTLLSLFFQNYGFRRWAYEYWADWQPTDFDGIAEFGMTNGWDKIHDLPEFLYESPSLFSVFFGLFLMSLFALSCLNLFTTYRPIPILNIRYWLLSGIMIVLMEMGIFAYPPIKRSIQEKEFLRKEKKISDAIIRIEGTRTCPATISDPDIGGDGYFGLTSSTKCGG